ncbi:MAG: transposase [Burkholderiales bacterium]|nr:transposase [Burkholderiales bacterium]MBI3731099.1 transposase [Burkholderiales bacterium]
MSLNLTGGQCRDATQAKALIRDIYPEAVLADKAYDAEGLIFRITEKNAKVVIPPKSNRIVQREFDKQQYRNRNVIGRFFPESNSLDALQRNMTNWLLRLNLFLPPSFLSSG